LRVSLPGVTSAASVSVDVLAGRAVEVVAGAFALTHDLPFALAPDETATAVKWSKKTKTLTLAFRRGALQIAGLDLDPGLLYVSEDPEGKKGRMLRAARDIEAGETVLVCEPVAAAVHDNAADDACADCFAAAARHRCARCPARYCDARCAANDVAHEGECALVARLGGASKIRGARMFLRLLYLRATRPAAFEKTNVWRASEPGVPRHGNAGSSADFADDSKSVLGSVAFLRSVLPNSALPGDPERFIRAARENLHGVVRADGTLVGSAAYAAASLANHACDPNCVASFLTGDDDERDVDARREERATDASVEESFKEKKKKKPLLAMRATRRVRKHEEVTLGYVELYASRGERRARLLKSKGFECACARCRDPPETERALTGWRCARTECPGVAAHDAFVAEASHARSAVDGRTDAEGGVQIESAVSGKGDSAALLRCGSCGGATASRATRASATAAETRWRGVVQRARDAARAGNHASSFALAFEGLRETEPLLHDAHVVRHELRLALAAAAEKTSRWPAAADACAATAKHMARVVSARHPGLVDQRAALARAIEKARQGGEARGAT
jgi:SET and MYND domain-containing protein